MNDLPPSVNPPSERELDNRLSKLQDNMRASNLDFYICHCPDNIYYLTNFANFVHERPFILLIPKSGIPYFVIPRLEGPHVLARSLVKLEQVCYSEFPAPQGTSWACRLQSLIPKGSKIGVEDTAPAYLVRMLEGDIDCQLVYSPLVDTLREIKSHYEISRIEYTCNWLSTGHKALLANAKVGQTFIEAYSQTSALLMAQLLADRPTTNMLATNIHAMIQPPSVSHDPHNFTNVFMPQEQGGPHVTVITGKADGYGAEIERTFFLNSVPENAKRPFEVMLAARQIAFDLTRPGQSMAEVDRQVKLCVESAGYADNWLHRTGHSFGVTQHEGPFLAEGYQREIQANMVFSIEPGIYLPGIGGFRFSDTVLVTEDGNRCLTEAPETLEELTIINQ